MTPRDGAGGQIGTRGGPTKAKPGDERRQASTPIPDGWAPSPEIVAWVVETLSCDRARVDLEVQKFLDDARTKDRRCVNWVPAFRNWVRKAVEFDRSSPPRPARVQQPAPPDTRESWRLRSGAPAPKPLWERDGVAPTKGPAPAPTAASAPEEPDVSMPDGFLSGLVSGIGAGAEAAVKPEPPVDVAAVYRAEFKAARGEEPPFGPPEDAAVSKLLDALDGDAGRACRIVRAAFANPFWREKATIRTIADDPARFSNRNPSRVPTAPRSRTPVQGGPVDYAASAEVAAQVRARGPELDPDAPF